MTGPAVGILLKEKLSESAKVRILAFIDSSADEVRGEDFWIAGMPFAYEFGPECPEEVEEYSDIESLIGWKPKDIIGLCAMCNGEREHISLGELTLNIAKMINGKIAFGYTLDHYTNESIINPEVFESWLKHKDFRMVK